MIQTLPFVVLWRYAKPLLSSILPVSSKSMEEIQKTPELIVNWGREKLHIEFTEQGTGSLEETTLKELKERLKEITGVPINGQKLVFSGAIMKDETATLTSFGLQPFSKLILMGSKPNTTSGSSEEHALIARITQSVEKTKANLVPQIESFETSVATYLSSEDNDDTVKSKLTEEHHCIVETLMQSILTLDSVVCPPEFETARQKRREAVKFTQGLIDRVDEVKAQLSQQNQQNITVSNVSNAAL
ncbi:18678_t:CDS:2 [Dentiscutata erythropus]|uniref:18678_t:CDS:1 n=1 Tax=Dentiscutata erythropus TaxID=1348616 RepID=A0A9N9HX49_9GLOM|nr:18678_t:CDS:2 [Dentiscutata erythropus]